MKRTATTFLSMIIICILFIGGSPSTADSSIITDEYYYETTVANTILEETTTSMEAKLQETTAHMIETTTTIVETTIPETTAFVETIPEETEPIITTYRYGRRMTPAVKINTDNGVKNHTEEVDTSGYKYYGKMYITGYTPKCIHCCGNDKGITASGVEAISGYTVAAGKEFKFGTTLYIEGYGYYVVEDRGNLGKNVIDIAAPDHETCREITGYGIDVYVVPNNFTQQ